MDAQASDSPRPRLKVGLGAGIVLVLAALVVAVLVSALSPRGETVVIDERAPTAQATPRDTTLGDTADTAAGSDDEPIILVHVLGAVARPGLYELHEGDRVLDAVAAAGGYVESADQAQLNLARVVKDGEQLYAPSMGEAPPPGAAGSVPGAGPGSERGEGALVDLNSADQTALETLPRVGPETARKILDYREKTGPFSSVDDLLEVPGIGQKTLEGLRERVTV